MITVATPNGKNSEEVKAEKQLILMNVGQDLLGTDEVNFAAQPGAGTHRTERKVRFE